MNDQPEIRISPFSATQNRVARHFFSFFQCWYLLRFGLVSIFLVVCCCCSAYSVARSTGLTATSNRRWYFRFISFHLIWFDLICFDVCGLSGGVARCHLAAEPAATLDGFILLISAPRHGDFPIELKRCQNPTGIRRPFPHWLPFPEMKKKPSNSPTGWLIQISAAHSSHSFFPPLSLTRRKFVVPPAPSTSLLDICGRIYLLQLVIIIQKKKGNKPKDNNKNNQTKQQQNKKRLFVSMELDTRFHQLSLIPPQSTTTIKKKKNVWLDLISTVIATAHLTQSWAFKHPFYIYIYIYIYIQLLISNF